MKILIFLVSLFVGAAFLSCDKTTKESSGSADTMVMKKDTAIKRTDTAGFSK